MVKKVLFLISISAGMLTTLFSQNIKSMGKGLPFAQTVSFYDSINNLLYFTGTKNPNYNQITPIFIWDGVKWDSISTSSIVANDGNMSLITDISIINNKLTILGFDNNSTSLLGKYKCLQYFNNNWLKVSDETTNINFYDKDLFFFSNDLFRYDLIDNSLILKKFINKFEIFVDTIKNIGSNPAPNLFYFNNKLYLKNTPGLYYSGLYEYNIDKWQILNLPNNDILLNCFVYKDKLYITGRNKTDRIYEYDGLNISTIMTSIPKDDIRAISVTKTCNILTYGNIVYTFDGKNFNQILSADAQNSPMNNSVSDNCNLFVLGSFDYFNNVLLNNIFKYGEDFNVSIVPQGNTTFCQGGYLNLNASNGANYTYKWYNNGQSIPGAINATYKVTASGNYTVKVMDGACYTMSTPTNVIVNSNPIVTLNSLNPLILKTSTPIQLVGNPSGGVYSGNGVVNSILYPSKANLGNTLITYSYTSPQGCSASETRNTIIVDSVGNVCKTIVNDTVSILKIKFKLTTGIKSNQYTNISIYPNPTSDLLIIDVSDIQALGGYRYKILDLLGQELYNTLVTSVKTEVSLKTLGSKGVYLLHIVDANGNSIKENKVVLE